MQLARAKYYKDDPARVAERNAARLKAMEISGARTQEDWLGLTPMLREYWLGVARQYLEAEGPRVHVRRRKIDREPFVHPKLKKRKRRTSPFAKAEREWKKQEQKKQKGFVYVMKHPYEHDLVKIGWSDDPNERLKPADILSVRNRNFWIHDAVPADKAWDLEQECHRILKARGLWEGDGEWFVMQEDHAYNFVAKVKRDGNGRYDD